MSIAMAIFTFINAWWIMLFFVLPFHVRQNQEKGALDYEAAPQTPRWRRILLTNTAAAALVTALLALVINSGLIRLDTIVL